MRAFFSLFLILPAVFCAIGDPCKDNTGTCQSISSCNESGGSSIAGFCPRDRSEIRCCIKSGTAATSEPVTTVTTSSSGNVVADIVGAAPSSQNWQVISGGIYGKKIGDGKKIFIGFAGWSAGIASAGMPDGPKNWIQSIATAANLAEKGYGYIIAVRGPTNSNGYDLELNRGYAKILPFIPADTTDITIVGHSSGGFTSAAFTDKLSQSQVLKTTYYNLDGSGGQKAKKIYYVYSQREGTNDICHNQRYVGAGVLRGRIKVVDQSCKPISQGGSNAGWCLHEALVVKSPTDTVGAGVSMANVNKDYQKCTPQNVVHSYLSNL